MGVSLSKNRKGGKIYLRLKYQKTGMTPKYESLGMFLYDPPKGQDQRTHNRETEKLSKRILLKKQSEALEGIYEIRSRNKDVGLLSYFQLIIAKRKEKENSNWNSTYKQLELYLNGYDQPIRDFKLEDLQDFYDFLLENLKISTANVYMSSVKKVFDKAFKAGYVKHDSFDDVKMYPRDVSEKKFLLLGEIKKFRSVPTKRPLIKNAFLFSCLTGLRISDIRAFDREKLVFNEKHEIYFYDFEQKKTSHRAPIPINQEALELLNEDRFPFEKLPTTTTILTHVKEITKKAGINKDVNFHTSRHTFGTLHAMHGTDVATTSKLLGHKSLSSTMVYFHIVDEMKIDAMKNIPSSK